VADHVWGSQYTGGVDASQIEAYTTLGFIAAHTRRVRLLALATAVPYRNAGLLGKMVTTLDVLSGGRAMLGIGAGDYAEEAEGPGTAPPIAGRAVRAARGDGAGVPAHVGGHPGRRAALPRQARPHAAPAERAAEPEPAASADPDRWERRAADAAAGGEVRRCVQHPPVARDSTPAGPATPAVRARGSPVCSDREDGPFFFDVGADGSGVGELLGKLRWLAGMGIEMVFGWVVGIDRITPIEVMGRDVIPAVRDL
jgi:Luciferase-like monooxygenase